MYNRKNLKKALENFYITNIYNIAKCVNTKREMKEIAKCREFRRNVSKYSKSLFFLTHLKANICVHARTHAHSSLIYIIYEYSSLIYIIYEYKNMYIIFI